MKIDWFTFAAQIINFVVLLALLKRFLYRPILQAIADREAEIAFGFERAGAEQAAAESARQEFEARTEELANAKQKLLAEAADEVERWKAEHLAEAKREVDVSRAVWFQTLDRERGSLRESLLAQYQQHGLRLAEGILGCLADENAQQLLVTAFARKLLQASDAGRNITQGEPVTVRSAFELSPDQQREIRAALRGDDRDPGSVVQFRIDQTLICGLELRTADHEVSWNAREALDYLAIEFRRDIDETLAMPVGLANPLLSGDSDDAEVTDAR